ncbi:MAG: hypothetical protein WAU23_15110 [Ferruginibacter sp.]
MKRLFPILVAICCPIFVFSQDITGLWKGSLINETANQTLDYEIFINQTGGKLSAFSHTWFIIDNQRYYGIKKLHVRIAKDGKIVMQDALLVENNYPIAANKNVIQLNVLDLVDCNNEMTLSGLFVTNSSRNFKALNGRIKVTRVNPLLVQSDLMNYIEKENGEGSLTVVK